MRNIAILTSVLYLSGCATIGNVNGQPVPNDNQQFVKTVGTIIAVGLIAGAVGRANQKSKCDNNRAGFWRDNVTGNVYTCP
jgi:hypothetical protein